MAKLSYSGRIHKGKLTWRSLRYVAADRLARSIPALQRRWQFPVDSMPIADAAESRVSFPTVAVDGERPAAHLRLFPDRILPVRITQNVFTLRDVTVTGQAGAMQKDGRLLTVRENHNWAIALRPRPHRLRRLGDGPLYYNLVSPIPARGHIFHWLFDFTLPLVGWLESGKAPRSVTLLVNAERLAFQNAVLDVLLRRYPDLSLEPVAADDAVIAPRLAATVFTPYAPRALQTEMALSALDWIADALAEPCPEGSMPKRFYVSREDARLRRVANEAEIASRLEDAGFRRVILKGMPIPAQVRLFRDAEAIVAPHGAGLAHIAWCRPGTRVFEIFPSPDGPRGRPRNATDNFWLVARLRGLRYDAAFGGPTLNRTDRFEIPLSVLSGFLEMQALMPV